MRRLLSAIAVGFASVLLISEVSPASAADSRLAVADGARAQVGVPTGYVVIGTGLSRKDRIVISWGDGTAQALRGICSARRAKARPAKCRLRIGHVYSSPGPYDIRVSGAKGKVLGTGTIMVAEVSTSDADESAGQEVGHSNRWREAMTLRINEVRSQNAVGSVQRCPRLESVAQDYAELMADTGHYGHTGPSGESAADRVLVGGYDYRITGENIAVGYRSSEDVQTAWEESRGHFENMINPRFADVGLGAYASADGRWYWVQVYGSGGSCDATGASVDTIAPL